MKEESTLNSNESTAVQSKFKALLNDTDFLLTTLTTKQYFITFFASHTLQVTIEMIKVYR